MTTRSLQHRAHPSTWTGFLLRVRSIKPGIRGCGTRLRALVLALILGGLVCHSPSARVVASTVLVDADAVPCDVLPGRIDALKTSDRIWENDDQAEMLLRYIQAAKACVLQGSLPDLNRQMTPSLLVSEVVALNLLDRPRDARDVVDTFFERYAERADSTTVAQMYVWDVHLQVQRGNVTPGLARHWAAHDYAHHLPPIQRSRFETQRAFFLHKMGQVERARQVAAEAERILQDQVKGDEKMSTAYRSALGNAMYQHAESLLYDRPGNARQIYEAVLTFCPPVASTPVLLSIGETYAVEGRLDSALVYFDRGQARADAEGGMHHRVRVRLLRGAAYASNGRVDDARHALVDAAMVAEKNNVDRHYAQVHVTLGDVYERQSQTQAALHHYRRAARHPVDLADARAVRTKLDAQQAVLRLLEPHRSWLGQVLGGWLDWIAGGIAILVLTAVLRFAVRRNPDVDASRPAADVPDAIPHRVLQACQAYVTLWRTPDDRFPEGERHRYLARTRHAVFVAAMKWMYGDDVWEWLDSMRDETD